MSYPWYLEAYLVEIGGNSCGPLSHRLEFDDDADPPEYREVTGAGAFAYACCFRVDHGGGVYSWDLQIWYMGQGHCEGQHTFRRVTNEDDPCGEYGLLVNGAADTTAGKASIYIVN